MDEDGNYIELGGEFPLEENEHFNKLPVNTLMSDIQVPTNVYNKGKAPLQLYWYQMTHTVIWWSSKLNGHYFMIISISWSLDPEILNGVYMSEALNDVFISNFQKDPTLTWQFFGSSTGFFRLYPGTLRDYRVTSFNAQNVCHYIPYTLAIRLIIHPVIYFLLH